MTTLLHDAFTHHIWATERLLDACEALTQEQLRAPSPGTYGPIIDTLRHMVGSDGWYLTFFREWDNPLREDGPGGLPELHAANKANGEAWTAVLDANPDPDADLVEEGEDEQGQKWKFHAPTAFRLAQVIHHGTDHRSQVCTALTSLGIEPPGIDVWDYGEAMGRTREERSTQS